MQDVPITLLRDSNNIALQSDLGDAVFPLISSEPDFKFYKTQFV